MSYKFGVSICDTKLVIEADDAGFSEQLVDKYKNFIVDVKGCPGIGIRVLLVDSFQEDEVILNEDVRDGIYIQTAGAKGMVSGDRCEVEISRKELPLVYFDSFLRILFAHWLIKRGGILIHSAGIGISGKGYCFPSKSGGGKSTLSGVLAKEQILTDELSALVPRDGGWHLFGTPFLGSFAYGGVNISIPLKRILFLQKSEVKGDVKVKGISRGKIVSGMLKLVLCYSKDNEVSLRVISNVLHLIGKVNVGVLHYNKECLAGDILRAIL